jgi:hypothetical protein
MQNADVDFRNDEEFDSLLVLELSLMKISAAS